MPEIEVAVPTPLPRTFTYLAPGEVAPGSRVLVPFGKRQLVGVALGPAGAPAEEGIALKEITSVIDESPVYSPSLLELARWLSSYYLHPLGEVLRAMLPASSAKVVKEVYILAAKGEKMRADASLPLGRALARLFAKTDSLSRLTLNKRLAKLAAEIERASSASDPDAKPSEFEGFEPPSLRQLVAKGLITKVRGTSVRARTAKGGDEPAGGEPAGEGVGGGSGEQPKPLTALQEKAFAAICAEGLRQGEPLSAAGRVFLLHGVTGSGKTEVYLHLIAEVLNRPGESVLVLVPEISLTPQMTRVFECRFPGQVAVVHSAMGDPERWAQLERTRRGQARILIGPRSAVFGPFPRLALIVVDEEHDGSYKQATGLTYNGRDVAVLRGRLEGAVVVLGSATPSLESYNNAQTGRYRLLELPERVTGRPLPQIELVSAENDARRHGKIIRAPRPKAPAGQLEPWPGASPGASPAAAADDDASEMLPVSDEVVAALRANLAAGHQAIVLVNRRGYAYYLFSVEQKKPVQCPHCSISLTLHAKSTLLRCHYCDYRTGIAQITAERPGETFVAIGYGSQRAEEGLRRLVPGARIVRLDSDVVADRDVLPRTLHDFREHRIDILVGTQILAKGHDFPNVTLIAILEVDQTLGLPDFRAGERTFQLIVQAAGRSGRAELAGRVMIQTMRADHPVVVAALQQDYASFVGRELAFRRQHCYPPFARMIAFELSDEEPARLLKVVKRIEGWLEQMARMKPLLFEKVRVLGPAVPPIEKVRARYRRTMILSSEQLEPLRQLAGQFHAAFGKLSGDTRLRVDVDPQSLI